MGERRQVRIGNIEWCYWIEPYDMAGQQINGGNHYANATGADGLVAQAEARQCAERMLGGDGVYLGYMLGSVQVHGYETEFTGAGWQRVKGGRSDGFTVTRADAGLPPVFVDRHHQACYDSTAMDYFETVHAMRTDGSCQCGDPTRNVHQ